MKTWRLLLFTSLPGLALLSLAAKKKVLEKRSQKDRAQPQHLAPRLVVLSLPDPRETLGWPLQIAPEEESGGSRPRRCGDSASASSS